jgi:hypothetical protein
MRSPGPVRQTQRTGGTPGLAREITPALLLLFIVGDILGGGIYALVGEVGERTGGGIWAAFLLALVALLAAIALLPRDLGVGAATTAMITSAPAPPPRPDAITAKATRKLTDGRRKARWT